MSDAREVPVVFECGSERLLAMAHVPVVQRGSVGVLVIVGGPQYRAGSHRQFVLMARALARAGYPVMRFDYRGMGDSEGLPRNFEGVNDDVRAAIDCFIRAVPSVRQVYLWGLCDAASASLMYASTDKRVGGLMIANPWVHTEAGAAASYIKHYYGQRLLQRSFWTKVFKGEFNVIASTSDFARKFLRAFARRAAPASPSLSFIERMRRGLQEFRGPTLILISEHDLTAQEFRDLCGSQGDWRTLVGRSSVERFDLDGADHTFSAREALERATARCIAWLEQHTGKA